MPDEWCERVKWRDALIAHELKELESAMQWKRRCQDTSDLCACSVEMQPHNANCSEVRTEEQELAVHLLWYVISNGALHSSADAHSHQPEQSVVACFGVSPSWAASSAELCRSNC